MVATIRQAAVRRPQSLREVAAVVKRTDNHDAAAYKAEQRYFEWEAARAS